MNYVEGCIQAVILFCCAVSQSRGAYYTENEWEITNFRAVTQFEGLASYYERLRRTVTEPDEEESIVPQDAKIRAHIWKTICDNVFRSPFFVARGERWTDPDLPSVRKKLADEYRRLFDLIDAETVTDSSNQAAISYRNGYRILRTAYTDATKGPIDEHVFLCIAEEVVLGTMKEYYISRDYNVNVSTENAYPIVGRLIFTPDIANSNQLVVEALAEETSIEAEFFRRIHIVELYYIGMRRHTSPSAEELDPICTLSDAEKLRLCASFLGAATFERKGLVFKPLIRNVLLPCVKKRINIKTPIFAPGVSAFTRMIMDPHKNFEEWTIGCQAFPASSAGAPVTYYVSRGISHNSIYAFTYSSEIQQLSIHGFFNNVSVVGDFKSTSSANESEGETQSAIINSNVMVNESGSPLMPM